MIYLLLATFVIRALAIIVSFVYYLIKKLTIDR